MSINFQNSMFDQNQRIKSFGPNKNLSMKARSFSRKSLRKLASFKSRKDQQVVKDNSQSWFIPVPKKKKSKSKNRTTNVSNNIELKTQVKKHNFTLGPESNQEQNADLQWHQ